MNQMGKREAAHDNIAIEGGTADAYNSTRHFLCIEQRKLFLHNKLNTNP
jgi:hypothetical protein